MHEITPIVKNIIIANVIIFCIIKFNLLPMFPQLDSIFTLFPMNNEFKPYQVFTFMFNHADFRHLIFNMLGLYFIGSHVESTLGPKRFLNLYVVSGLVSAVTHLFLSSYKAVGASGAIYGVLAGFAAMFPNMKMMVFPIPFEIKAMYLVGFYILYDLYNGLSVNNTGIAHFAHIGGAAAGIALIFYWNKQKLY
jgi:membrane associated rhomboid family serine protease